MQVLSLLYGLQGDLLQLEELTWHYKFNLGIDSATYASILSTQCTVVIGSCSIVDTTASSAPRYSLTLQFSLEPKFHVLLMLATKHRYTTYNVNNDIFNASVYCKVYRIVCAFAAFML